MLFNARGNCKELFFEAKDINSAINYVRSRLDVFFPSSWLDEFEPVIVDQVFGDKVYGDYETVALLDEDGRDHYGPMVCTPF